MFNFEQFYSLVVGILAGATPFLVLGVLVATLIERYAKHEWFSKILVKNKLLSHIYIALFGLFIPVCECGNVPVVRKLMLKGFSLSHVVTFLLAAPIVNPVTIWTTWEAFSYAPWLVFFRIGGGLVIAITIGLVFSTLKNPRDMLLKTESNEEMEHTHKGVKSFSFHFIAEFANIFKMLTFGAIIAALVQVAIPREVLFSLASNPLFSILTMILFAFIISVCSNVDSFIALGLSSTFSLSSLLAFLVFGPMIDIKTVIMLRSTFSTKFIVYLTTLVLIFSTLLAFIYYALNSLSIL
jgi:uncharacterized protein